MSDQQKLGLSTHQSLRIYLIVLGWSVLVLCFGIRLGSKYRPEKLPNAEAVELREEQDLRRGLEDYPVEEIPDEVLPPRESFAEPALPYSQLTEKERVLKENSYTIQVAALKSVAEARSEVKRLLSKGYDARVAGPGLKGGYFKVWVGEYRSEEETKEMEAKLEEAGFSTYVRKIYSSFSQ